MDNNSVNKFINEMFKTLDDPVVNKENKGSKDNPYIRVCNKEEFKYYKPLLDENDMLEEDVLGWVKYVLAPSVRFK